MPEVGLVRPCHGSSTPVRISHSRPPCVIPMSLGAGTGRKYPPTVVLARQPTTGCFVDGWDRSAPSLAVIDAEQLRTGGLGAPSSVAWPLSGSRRRERVQDRIFTCQKANAEWPLKVPLYFHHDIKTKSRSSKIKFFQKFLELSSISPELRAGHSILSGQFGGRVPGISTDVEIQKIICPGLPSGKGFP